MQEVYVWLYVRELVDVFFEYKPFYMIWYEKKIIPNVTPWNFGFQDVIKIKNKTIIFS